jgi:8-amino-7-oxononanoate synthase
MSLRTPISLEKAALERVERGRLRSLKEFSSGVDLSSNDYLGISRLLAKRDLLQRLVANLHDTELGATGSRLITGTRRAHRELEEFLAEFHGGESALVFGSGYEANVALLSSVASRSDTILYDEYVHASMRDGIRLSPARAYSFRHNDLSDLSKKLRDARGEVFIAVESLYSMDGDLAPLDELCKIAEELNAHLLVDEAHSTGIYGPKGRGLVALLGLESRVFARIHTFGKALGFRGACVIGPTLLQTHLVNTARPFIYSTAPDTLSLCLIREAYQIMQAADAERSHLKSLISSFSERVRASDSCEYLPSSSPIQAAIVPGNETALAVERALHKAGFFARAIRPPTIPAGRERIRICIHSFNSTDELLGAISVMEDAFKRLRT